MPEVIVPPHFRGGPEDPTGGTPYWRMSNDDFREAIKHMQPAALSALMDSGTLGPEQLEIAREKLKEMMDKKAIPKTGEIM